MGQAYGFFDSRASKEEIEAEIPFIRKLTEIPSALELSLTEGANKLKGLEGDPKLIAAYKKAKSQIVFPKEMSIRDRSFIKMQEIGDTELRYAIEATCPDVTNKETADELAAILSQAYNSPLFETGDVFRGGIVYKDTNGEYISRE